MKQTFIKSICIALLACGMTQTATAQGIVVNRTDGTKVYYKASEVQSVGVYGYGEGPGEDPDVHEYVDLGLPSGTLWATMNVGAEKAEDYGDYFAWGETSGFKDGKTDFSWATYRYYGSDGVTKYCTNTGSWYYDNKTELEMGDDAATVNWGVSWQMPSNDQFEELMNNSYTTTSWTTLNGVYGILIVSKSNGNKVFLPAAGARRDASLESAGRYGLYWSRSLGTGDSSNGRLLIFDLSIRRTINADRYQGTSVRPVRVP